MNAENFNNKYRDKGGIVKLSEMIALLFPLSEIGKHFGFTKTRARQIISRIYGEPYDPRKCRKDALIKVMTLFAKHNDKKTFIRAFSKKDCFREALQKCIDEKLYDS